MQSIKVAHPALYKKNGSLLMLDGTGQSSESWTMYGTWPTDVDWGTLEYTSPDIQTIEVTMNYDRAIRNCVTGQTPQPIAPNCPQL